MTNKLQQFFPTIRTRQEILNTITQDPVLNSIFTSWPNEQQDYFLNFCSGAKGCKILYDSFFKEIFNPEATPERLEGFLALLLKQTVKILHALPNDSTRIADENSLLIMDIVVELEDHSIANVEVQRLGYMFPGQRSACYSADLLLRQYKRVRSEKKKNFSYKDIKKVYTIVLFERSPKEYHEVPNSYIHRGHYVFDTGLKVELLQEYVFIPLDIFRKIKHNNIITDHLDAWLSFLIEDDPDHIIKLIQGWPEFIPMYEDIYALCRNMRKIMGLFSDELKILDQNTVQYMMDEMQDEIDAKRETIAEQDSTIASQKDTIAEQKDTIAEQKDTIAEQEALIAELRKELENK
ncbi:MAG: PD-(D/E)XK nuclease family transposase [Lachnospiraceae bacterium]|nr:PD-(D/E)XK nuclease family transposase [Lachnospiraceae bacterium]